MRTIIVLAVLLCIGCGAEPIANEPIRGALWSMSIDGTCDGWFTVVEAWHGAWECGADHGAADGSMTDDHLTLRLSGTKTYDVDAVYSWDWPNNGPMRLDGTASGEVFHASHTP